MKTAHALLLLPLMAFSAMAQQAGPDWQDSVWADVMATPPAASELHISEVSISRNERQTEAQNAADRALAAGDWMAAERELAELLAAYPEAHEARMKLASLQYGRGSLATAKALLQQGLALAPAEADVRLTLARILTAEERHAAAWKLLDEASPALATHLDYYALKAEAGRRSGRCDAATALYHQLLAEQQRGPWWLGLGLCQRSLGQDFSLAFEQARSSVDLGAASLKFVEQQLEHHGTTQTH